MAILKHIASKSSNYGAALEYLIFKHDELRKTPILDQNGNRIMRDEFYLDGLNCEPYSFDAACQQLNREYQKNKNKNEIKSHHYIISFDPRDSTENCLTGKRAQELGLEYAKANFPGHQALVCTHMDGHNGSGNIHVHIVINSLRKLDVPPAALYGATRRLQGRVQAPCDERVPEASAEIPHGFVPLRISASGRFTVTIQNGRDRGRVLGTAAAG